MESHKHMNGRTIAQVILALVLITGVVFLGIGAYNAGVTQGLVQSGQVVVAPGAYVGPYVGGPYVGGWGHGFSFFGFLGTLFFILLLFGLLRAVFGRGRGWGGGHGGWGGPGGPGRYPGPWEDRAREIHDEWHRSRDAGGTDRPSA
jgi:hypothetical protein